MKRYLVYLVLGLVAAIGLYAGVASGGDHPNNPPPTTTGHTPVTICHKPGTPAEQTLVVDDDAVPGHLGHGDYLGECEGTPPPTETNPPPTETNPPPTMPTTPTTPHQVTGSASAICDNGIYRVSGTIDGQAADSVTPATIPGSTKGTVQVTVTRGDTSYRTTVTVNGDCEAPPPVVTTTPPATTQPPTTTTTPPAVTPPPVKPKPVAPKPKPRPVPPKKHKTPPPPKKHVCKTLKDGTKRVWYDGGNGIKPGCYPVIEGSG